MEKDFLQTTLGRNGKKVLRLGLSGTYRPGKQTIYKALDEGINYFFCYGFDTQLIRILRDVIKSRRDDYVIATGAYNYIFGHQNFRRTLEKRLRQFGTDHIDVYMLLGATKPEHFSESMREEFYGFRAEGKIGNVGLSTHNRKFAGELAVKNAVDVMMVRYNAAHRGAEQEIFPNVKSNNPGIISYTATRWRYLLRRPSAWPKGERIPTAGMCYRFVLSNPAVDVCMTAPSNLKQLEENLAAFKEGPLATDDMAFMHKFGGVVHAQKNWFM